MLVLAAVMLVLAAVMLVLAAAMLVLYQYSHFDRQLLFPAG